MVQHDSLDRRTMLAGGGALFIGAAFGPARLHAQTGSAGKIPIGTVGAGHITCTTRTLRKISCTSFGQLISFASTPASESRAQGRLGRKRAPSIRGSRSAMLC